MDGIIDVLVRHGYLVVFGWVLAEQIGLPLPAVPFLLAGGALAGNGRLSLALVLAAAALASLVSDSIWYWIGRVGGGRVLRWLCRIFLEPDSCVRRTQDAFGRYGARSLLFAKFVPGFNTAAPPLAVQLPARAGGELRRAPGELGHRAAGCSTRRLHCLEAHRAPALLAEDPDRQDHAGGAQD